MKEREFYLETEYRKLVEKYIEPAKEELIKFLSINSIYDETSQSKDKPFGAGVDLALEFVATLGKKLGFAVDRCDNYATELSIGEGKLLDIYAHADVVPVSKNWKHEPFLPMIEGDYLFARGAMDDKGPGIACVYAAKALMDSKRLDGYKLRIIFGGNEERGSKCLHYYFNDLKKEYPTYGFTPDSDFPMIYAEKGIFSIGLHFPLKKEKAIPSFDFGEAMNIVLDECLLKLDLSSEKIEEALAKYRVDYPMCTISFHKGELHFFGKSVHGAMPWLGVNAGLHLLNFLGSLYDYPLLSDIYSWLHVGDGKAMGADFKSPYFNSSSYCIGKMKCDGKVLTLMVNMRLPENISKDDAIKTIASATGAVVEDFGGMPALIVEPSSPLVQTLLKVYQEETGDKKSKPMAIGGGTYARESKNTIAFGPTFTGRDCRIHQDDEFILLSDFENMIGIYAHAIEATGALLKE